MANKAVAQSVEREQARIVEESKQIVDGRRTAYSEPTKPPAARVAPKPKPKLPPAARVPPKPKPKAKPKQPAATHAAQPSAPATVPKPATVPTDGYDPAKARRAAPAISNHLRRAGQSGYDHRLIREWQRLAGLKADGLYGGATRGALQHFGATDAPPAFFKPTTVIPYHPPR